MILAEGKSKKPPISRHPLFPVTVALWFGALFGLSSMAIKPSLIEQAVLALGLPSIIPAAEPPLGATTQLLLALTMAGIGGLLGAMLARRLGRPKIQQKQRRRDAASVLAAAIETDAVGELDAEQNSNENAINRRRQLALQEEARPSEYHDRAPLPGVSPHILDVTELDLDGFEADQLEPVQEFVAEDDEDLSGDNPESSGISFGEKPEAPEGVQIFGASQEAADSLLEDHAEEAGQEDHPADEAETDAVAQDEVGEQGEEAGEREFASRAAQVFGYIPLFAQDSEEDEADCEDSLDGEFASSSDDHEDDGEQASPFDAPAIEPVFARPVDDMSVASEDEAELDDGGEPEGDDVVLEGNEEGPLFGRVEQAGRTAPGRVGSSGLAASRIMTASLSELSHAELLERLATTLERNRNREAEANADPAQVLPEAPEMAADIADGSDVGEDLSGEAAPQFAAPAAEHVVFEAPGEAETSGPEEEDAGEDEPGHRLAQPPVPTIPAALRPIAFDDDSDNDLLPSFVPPRHFSMSQQAEDTSLSDEDDPLADEAELEADDQPDTAEPESSADEAIAAGDGDADGNGESTDEERELEEGYSSLLSLSRPDRPQFVRIEEPEDADGDVKPFVVFPNEGAADHAPFARPVPGNDVQRAAASRDELAPAPEGDSEARRFDQPADDGREGIETVSQEDAEETERSLKAALATLQRMSGAA